MKYAAFRELCVSEWEADHGDVGTLWLTEKSYVELQDDALRQGSSDEMTLRVEGEQARERRAFRTLRNPVTRTIVKMRLARDTDVADVWFDDGHFETRFLDKDKARAMGFRV